MIQIQADNSILGNDAWIRHNISHQLLLSAYCPTLCLLSSCPGMPPSHLFPALSLPSSARPWQRLLPEPSLCANLTHCGMFYSTDSPKKTLTAQTYAAHVSRAPVVPEQHIVGSLHAAYQPHPDHPGQNVLCHCWHVSLLTDMFYDTFAAPYHGPELSARWKKERDHIRTWTTKEGKSK